jgi:hypothetical protein
VRFDSELRRVVCAAALILAAGCGGQAVDSNLIRIGGAVDLKGGQGRQLSGGSVEFQSTADEAVRARGRIEDDGTFEAVAFKDGRSQGVPPGTYRVRVIPPPEAETGNRPEAVIDRKFHDFRTSGLTVTVAAGERVTIPVERHRR